MSLRKALHQQHDGSKIIVCDSKSLADYACRLARERGSTLSQRKLDDGGWELHSLSQAALKRGQRSRHHAS